MTLDQANELITIHAGLRCSYNRNAVKMVAGEVDRDHKLEDKTQVLPVTKFTSAFTK